MSEVTQILHRVQQGNAQATEELLPWVHDELRKLAAVRMGYEPTGQTLQATALVHEAWPAPIRPGGTPAERARSFLCRRSRSHAAHSGESRKQEGTGDNGRGSNWSP